MGNSVAFFLESVGQHIAPHASFRQARVERRQVSRKLRNLMKILFGVKFQVFPVNSPADHA